MPELTRRTALTSTAILALTAFPVRAKVKGAVRDDAAVRSEPFPLDQVRLRPSLFRDSIETNKCYLLSLDADRFLQNFHSGAGLPIKGERYGGWEARGIAGHSLGHYLSALSLIYAQTGVAESRKRAS